MMDIFYFDSSVKKGKSKDFNKIKNKKIWIDVTNITKEEAKFLEKELKLHDLTTEDLLNQNIRIKVEEFSEYLFCIFYGIKKEKTIELQELDFILGKNFIITNHKKEISTITQLKNNAEKLDSLFKKGIDFLFHHILDNEVDNFFPVLEEIDDMIESIESEVTKKAKPEILQKIIKIKKNIILIKKSTLPQREKISFLAKNEYKFISKKAIPYFRDIYDHSIRVSDSIDNYREAIGGSFDVYMSSVSNSMNEVMKTLSIIATIMLPLGVISGIYGTNFDFLPGQHLAYGFWMMIFGMFLMVGIMIIMFRKRKWF